MPYFSPFPLVWDLFLHFLASSYRKDIGIKNELLNRGAKGVSRPARSTQEHGILPTSDLGLLLLWKAFVKPQFYLLKLHEFYFHWWNFLVKLQGNRNPTCCTHPLVTYCLLPTRQRSRGFWKRGKKLVGIVRQQRQRTYPLITLVDFFALKSGNVCFNPLRNAFSIYRLE